MSTPLAAERKRVPLWHRIESVLRHKIATGEYRIGDALPSEPALALAFGVSRMTVREAVRGLTGEGLVRQVQGKGTFVLRLPDDAQRSGIITGWVGEAQFNEAFPGLSPDPPHRVPRCSLIELATVEAPPDVRRTLVLEEPTVVRVERITTADGGPVAYVLDYLPHALGDSITREDLARAWLTQVLPEKLGVAVLEARETIEATLADVVLGEKLEVPFGAPLLHAERTYIGGDDRPLYVARVWHRADRFRYGAIFRFQPPARESKHQS